MKLEKLLLNDKIIGLCLINISPKHVPLKSFFITITAVIITLKMLKTKISKCRSGFVDGAYQENLCSFVPQYTHIQGQRSFE